jgi:hypothetical protein
MGLDLRMPNSAIRLTGPLYGGLSLTGRFYGAASHHLIGVAKSRLPDEEDYHYRKN